MFLRSTHNSSKVISSAQPRLSVLSVFNVAEVEANRRPTSFVLLSYELVVGNMDVVVALEHALRFDHLL